MCWPELPKSRSDRRSPGLFFEGVVVAFALSLVGTTACERSESQRLEEARAFLEAGVPGAAISAVEPVLEGTPSHAEANLLHGRALFDVGQAGRAIWALERAARSPEHVLEANRLLASAFFTQGDARNARLAASRALAIAPEDQSSRALRVRAALELGDCESAVADANAFAEPATRKEVRARAHECAEETEAALAIWQQLWAETSEEDTRLRRWTACTNYARLLDKTGAGGGDATLAACLALSNDAPDPLLEIAILHRSAGRVDEARAVLDRAAERHPEHVRIALELAGLLERTGDRSAALERLRVVARARDTADDWRRVAEVARRYGRPYEAEEALRHAIDLRPIESESIRFELADLLIARGRLDDARELSRTMDEAGMRAMVEGAIFLASDEPERALERLTVGLAEWPSNHGARFMAGEAARRTGDSERAIEEYREAIRVSPIGTPAVDRICDVLEGLGRQEEALTYLTEAFRRSADVPGSDSTRAALAYRAAHLLIPTGTPKSNRSAIEWLGQATELDENHYGAANDLAWLLAQNNRDLDRAFALAKRAVALHESEATLDTLASVRRARKGAPD